MMTPVEGDRFGPPAEDGRSVIRSSQDLVTALLFAAIGGLGLWYSLEWPTGTPAMMDSGFFPQVLSAAILISGGVMLVKSLTVAGARMPGIALRPLVGVTLAVVGFALTIERFGLVLAILVVVVVSNFTGTMLRPVALAVLWVSLTVMCVAIFVWGVELPLQVWPF